MRRHLVVVLAMLGLGLPARGSHSPGREVRTSRLHVGGCSL